MTFAPCGAAVSARKRSTACAARSRMAERVGGRSPRSARIWLSRTSCWLVGLHPVTAGLRMESDEQQGAGAGKAPAPAAKAELQDLTP
jgi:hypothetical protein